MSQKISTTFKNRHVITITDEAWNEVQSVAKKLGISVSELLEKIGYGELVVIDSEELEDLVDTIDGLEGLLDVKENGTVSWERVKAELGA
ncbi:hypothetical protein [Aerosakkonema funiforme]|uniref:Uncharacterized protein n=1 Tax=Aerosakkonema funiforme FACHB-1375 TaxID=2949571 RepID=A0A926ZH71_9CYAN|nr:hypothetical protein [Aerosakkonema funiforme]MBD2182978.1 hypothetical protein [Aerosakkonema funiforme FACHB-1375]